MAQFYRPNTSDIPVQQNIVGETKGLFGKVYIIKKDIIKVNPLDGSREFWKQNNQEPFPCANPYGQHGPVVVWDGDNGQVDKEKGIAMCFDCLEIRFPHQFRHRLPPPPPADFFKPKEWPGLELPPDWKSFNEELPPLPSSEEEYPERGGGIVSYSLEEEWKLNPPKYLGVEQMPERHPVENDRSPIVMSEEDMKRMREDIEAKIKSGEFPSSEQIDRDLKSGKIRYADQKWR